MAQIDAILPQNGEPEPSEEDLSDYRLLSQAVVVLDIIRLKIRDISSLDAIPYTLTPAIPAIRTLSSSLFELAPESSQKLCKLSIGLGSIAVDSAILTGAHCNFELSNVESDRLLDEAKLIADSKKCKLYPNLDTLKTKNT